MIRPEPNSAYYSEKYGIDKGLVVQSFKKDYKQVYYAGDSEPDVQAALLADAAFAKGELIPLLQDKGAKFMPFTYYNEVAEYLQKNGVIK